MDLLFRLIAKGASGGRGALLNQMTSHGSIVRTTMFLRKGEQIYILVGQEGGTGRKQVRMKILFTVTYLLVIMHFPQMVISIVHV